MTAPNRAQRRRQKAEWGRDMRLATQQAAGLWSIEIVRETSEPRRENVIPVLNWFAELEKGERITPLCMSCDAGFAWPAVLPEAFMLLSPRVASGKVVIAVTGICRMCAARRDADLVQSALALVKRMLPDARLLAPAHFAHGQAGHA